MKTKALIDIGVMDLTAKSDSQLTTPAFQPFAVPNNIKADPEEIKYSTLEKNYFALDGSFSNFPQPQRIGNVGYWSLSRSGQNKNFAVPIVLTISFTRDHTSIGLTLVFSQYSYCTHLQIQYFDSNNTRLSQKEFYPDSYEYFCEDEVVNYRKIQITFYSTNEAYRYLKLYRIQYGRTITFEGDNLISANMVEELNPLSDELSINTIDFVCFATDDRFNILNPQGAYLAFQKTQPIKAYKTEFIEDEEVLTDMGTFYLESWENKSEKSMQMKGIDLIGILENAEFDGGIYDNVNATTLISSIMTKANVSNYSTQGISTEKITGYLPICTCREALQQVLFSIGAVADCSRSEKINIYKLTAAVTPTEITSDKVLKNTKEIKQGEMITGVSVKTHSYSLRIETEILYEEKLSAGTYKIRFNSPASDLSIENGTIVESGANYAIITATGSGTTPSSKYRKQRNVKITGSIYDDLTSTITVTDGETHDTTNILSVEDCTLINSTNAETIANRILNHYKNLYQDNFEMILGNEKAGDNVITEKSDINQLNGYITKLDIDMTGGFLANAEVVAKVEELNE